MKGVTVQKSNSRWYPTRDNFKTPEDAERTTRQILDQHYSLQDRINEMQKSQPAATNAGDASGPATTKFLGLNVSPVDTATLADGATLKYDKKSGTFKFS
jgi:hypothetical protein